MDEDIHCSFCMKSRGELKKLVSGPNRVAICNECIALCLDIIAEKAESAAGADEEEVPPLTRSEIEATLDESVVGCDAAKSVLLAALLQRATGPAMMRAPRILLVGPSGVGKTELGKAACACAAPASYVYDVGHSSESAYVGEDVEASLAGLVQAAGSKARAATGVLFLDGFEKLEATPPVGRARDVSGENVQRELLRILDGTTVELPRYRSGASLGYIDTYFITVIAAVRASGLDASNVRRELVQRGLLEATLARFDRVVLLPPIDSACASEIVMRPGGALESTNRVLESISSRIDLTADALTHLSGVAASSPHGGWTIRRVLRKMADEVLILDTPPKLVRYDRASLWALLERA
jgi:ATP-dependent protease Clp ATPase subunit